MEEKKFWNDDRLKLLIFVGSRPSSRTLRDIIHGIPVPDYVEENASTKVVRIIQSYEGSVNKRVLESFSCENRT